MVLIDVDHIIILFFMPTLPKVPKDSIISTVLVKCVNSANLKFSMMWKVLIVVHSKIQIGKQHVQVASTSLHGLVVSLAPPALKKKLLSLEMRKDQVNNIH